MRITEKLIYKWITDGRGQGHGIEYVPWIKIARKSGLGKGHLELEYIPILGRPCHYLAKNELKVALLLLWLGILDLREQFPCWPSLHPHPLYLHPHFHPAILPWSLGTLACAKSIGIKHPYYPSTKIIHIPTIDLLATISFNGTICAAAFDVKPDEEDVPLDEGDLEKLAIKFEYCKYLSIPWKLVSGTKIPETLCTNLELYVPYSGELKPQLSCKWECFIETLNENLSPHTSLLETIQLVAEKVEITSTDANNLFKRALWFRSSNIDLRQTIVMSEPPKLSKNEWLRETQKYFFGEQQSC